MNRDMKFVVAVGSGFNSGLAGMDAEEEGIKLYGPFETDVEASGWAVKKAGGEDGLWQIVRVWPVVEVIAEEAGVKG